MWVRRGGRGDDQNRQQKFVSLVSEIRRLCLDSSGQTALNDRLPCAALLESAPSAYVLRTALKVSTMSRRCEITGVGPMVGHNVSHSNIKTKRRFLPSLKDISLASDVLGQSFKLKITNAGAIVAVDALLPRLFELLDCCAAVALHNSDVHNSGCCAKWRRRSLAAMS